MRKTIFKNFIVLAVVAIAVPAMAPGSVPAQSQNPVDAIKDAWNKVKPGNTGQPAPSQPTPGQRPAARQPGNAPPAAGRAGVNDTGPFTPPAGTKIEPVLMAPLQEGAQFAVSPHGIHVATASHSGSRQVIIYDGVVGPKFDQLVGQNGVQSIVFSPDGNRYAYCAQLGNEWVVMLDGKELARGSRSTGAIGPTSCMLGFTSNSKHLYFTSLQDNPSPSAPVRFFFDGKPGPFGAPYSTRDYVFSPDGDHFAYLVTDLSTPHSMRTLLFIDGQPAPYNAGDPQWSADSQHLYTKRGVRLPNVSATDVLLDGKPIMRAEYVVLYIPPVGNMVVALVRRGVGRTPTTEFLVIGGKEVPGSENTGSGATQNLAFSPDGKHYSAVYHDTNNRYWVFSDGKKGETYDSIGSFATYSSDATANYGSAPFTADSSTLVYMVGNGNKEYIVFGGQESDEILGLTDSLLSTAGKHFLTTGSGYVTLDGKVLHLPNLIPNVTQASNLGFSPDGAHYAFRLQAREGPSLYIDGVQQTAFRPTGGGQMTNINTRPYVFSPDSKHIAYFCRSANPAVAVEDMYLCLDDKAVLLGRVGPSNLTFSPDSNHLFWSDVTAQNGFRLFVDGKPVLDGFPGAQGGFSRETWQMGPDGPLSLLMQDGTGLKRVNITPSSGTSIGTLFGAAPGLAAKRQ